MMDGESTHPLAEEYEFSGPVVGTMSGSIFGRRPGVVGRLGGETAALETAGDWPGKPLDWVEAAVAAGLERPPMEPAQRSMRLNRVAAPGPLTYSRGEPNPSTAAPSGTPWTTFR